jgi:GT2 family glycosyltransferase
MKKDIDLSIIIVNHNGGKWIDLTLSSLKKFYLDTTTYAVETIVVDNASSDGSDQHIQKKFPWATLIREKTNTGFAAANNLAIAKTNSPFVLLLNSDVELNKLSNFDLLLQVMKDREEVAAVTPKLMLSNGQLDWASHRGEPTPWAAFCYFSGLEKLFPKIELFSQYHLLSKDLQTVHAIDACSGAAMLVRRSAISQVGLLDEQFFMYAEDLDWCRRFRTAGFQIIYNPNVVVTHHKNKSGLDQPDNAVVKRTNTYFYDTMLQYYDKHYGKMYPSFVRWLLQLILVIKKRKAL